MASSVFGSERQSEIIPLKDRIDQYFPPTELLYEYPRPGLVELEIKDKLKEFKPGGNYVLTYSRFCGKFIIVPPWHPLNFEPRQTSGRDYAQTVFEGGSVEPVLDKQGQVVAGNIVLHGPRQERLKKSVAAHGFTDHINFEVFDQGTIDLISILGSDILISKDGFASRGYIRPAVGRGIGRIGVRPEKSELIVDQSVSASNLRHYLGKEAYERGEVVAVFTDQQRLTPIVAKEARNYGNGSILAERAKRFGIGEIIFFGPYTVDKDATPRQIKEYVNISQGKIAQEKLLEAGVLADGMGEEILGITKKGTLVSLPDDVNLLKGKTRQYVLEKMAPKLGLKTLVSPFTLADLGETIDAIVFLGNAVKICPIQEIVVCNETEVIKRIKLNPGNPVSKLLVKRFSEELSGEVEPSDPSLLTRVEFSPEARAKLDEVYRDWI